MNVFRIAGLSVLFATCGGAAAADEFSDFFGQFAAKRDAINVLHADFEQKTISPDDILTSHGTITYASPRRIIFSYQNDAGDGLSQIFIIDNDRYYQYDADALQLQIFDIKDRPEVEAFFLPFENDTSRLTAAYDVRLVQGLESDSGAPRIFLTPKTTDDAGPPFESVTIALGEQDFLPTEILILNDAESSVRLTVSGYTINDAPDETMGRVHLPANVDIIENDAYVTTTNEAGMWVPLPMSARAPTVDDQPLDEPAPAEAKP